MTGYRGMNGSGVQYPVTSHDSERPVSYDTFKTTGRDFFIPLFFVNFFVSVLISPRNGHVRLIGKSGVNGKARKIQEGA